MNPSPLPSPSSSPLSAGGLNIASLFNGISTLFGSGTVGVIAGGVLIILLGAAYFYISGKITAAQQAAAAAQAAANAAAANAAAQAASAAQEAQIAADQAALSQASQAKLLALLQSLSDESLCTVAASAFGQAKVQATLGEQIPVFPLTAVERNALYALYGVGN